MFYTYVVNKEISRLIMTLRINSQYQNSMNGNSLNYTIHVESQIYKQMKII